MLYSLSIQDLDLSVIVNSSKRKQATTERINMKNFTITQTVKDGPSVSVIIGAETGAVQVKAVWNTVDGSGGYEDESYLVIAPIEGLIGSWMGDIYRLSGDIGICRS